MSWEITGIVLAGGRSTRMKVDKAGLSRGKGTLLEVVTDELKKVCSRIIIVSGDNYYQKSDCQIVSDIYKGCGPLGGIYTGLYYARTPYSIVVACDMPLFNAELARFLHQKSAGYQVVVPRDGSYYEPLAALYHESCKPVLSSMLEKGSRKITDAYGQLKVNPIPVEDIRAAGMGDIFMNINTPKDWENYCKRYFNENEDK